MPATVAITEPGPRGEVITDQSFLLLFNAHDQPVSFTLPGPELEAGWHVVVDTADVLEPVPARRTPSSGNGFGPANGLGTPAVPALSPAASHEVAGRSVVVLMAVCS